MSVSVLMSLFTRIGSVTKVTNVEQLLLAIRQNEKKIRWRIVDLNPLPCFLFPPFSIYVIPNFHSRFLFSTKYFFYVPHSHLLSRLITTLFPFVFHGFYKIYKPFENISVSFHIKNPKKFLCSTILPIHDIMMMTM